VSTLDVNVVILGGGPVGCTLAFLLNDVGVTNMIIDRDLEPYGLPRAAVMDDEIQRVFHDHGFADWLGRNTTALERADFVGEDGNVLIGTDMPPLGLQGVPPVVCHFQPDLDAMLRARCAAGGSVVKWGRTVKDMTDTGDGVDTVMDDGTTVRSRWFVGCDGASSWTRRHVGIELQDLRFDQEWLVVDIELNEGSTVDLPLGVRQYCHTERPVTYVKCHDRYRRWEFQVQLHEDAAVLNTPDGLWGLLAPWVTPDDARLVRSAVYRFHAVVATEMRRGNVFLAGDSAHQMPPFAGQGLNSGMRDAVNLAWKMSWVKQGIAGDVLFDTYGAERIPHVTGTVAHAVDLGRLIDQLAGRESHGVDIESGYGGKRPAPYLESGMVVPGDPRVGHQFWWRPAVSDALRADPTTFVVVTNEPLDVVALAHGIPVVNVVDPDATGGSFAVVVRPDRYVAAVAHSHPDLVEAAGTLVAHAR
jgi:3-(3-hydroxy-phenyl)propionate hydroxylase